MLLYAIPEYRLPKEILQKEIDSIKNAGINFKTNYEVGKDGNFKKLQQKSLTKKYQIDPHMIQFIGD